MNEFYRAGQQYGFDSIPENYFQKRHSEKKQLRRLGLLSGAAFLLYIIVQQGFLLLLRFAGVFEIYTDNSLFQSCMDTVLTFCSVLFSFFLLSFSF